MGLAGGPPDGLSYVRPRAGEEVRIMARVEIVEGIDGRHLDEALRLSHEAFAKKFRLGFHDADDFVRLFRDSVDTASCLSALSDGKLLGILTFQTADQEFYHLNMAAVFTRFWPPMAIRVVLNLLLLSESAAPRRVHCGFPGCESGVTRPRHWNGLDGEGRR